MRVVIAGLLALWTVLTVFAYLVVLPDKSRDDELVLALFEAGATSAPGELPENLSFLHGAWPEGLDRLDAAQIDRLPLTERRTQLQRMREWYQQQRTDSPDALPDLDDVPVLVWSTDDNPARRVQTRLFRAWHLREYGEPIDIVTDPSNRDITKTIVQCIAGAGPDIIEAYGPAELAQFVGAGVALDVTDRAAQDGFSIDRVFAAAVSSIASAWYM